MEVVATVKKLLLYSLLVTINFSSKCFPSPPLALQIVLI